MFVGRTGAHAGIGPFFPFSSGRSAFGKALGFRSSSQPRGKLSHGGKGIVRFDLGVGMALFFRSAYSKP